MSHLMRPAIFGAIVIGLAAAVSGAGEPATAQPVKMGGVTLDVAKRRIEISGEICLAEGPIELLACARGGKEYESIITLDCKPSDLQAALLAPQLNKIDAYRCRREAICLRYEAAFQGRVEFVRMHPDATSSRHLFPILAPDGQRDRWLDELGRHGIGVTVNYRPIHLMQWYRQEFGHRPGDFPAAERMGARTLSLPLHVHMSDAEVDYVIDRVLRLAEAVGTPRRQAV